MRINKFLTDQSGVALPVALAILFATAGLATVAARSGIVSSNQSLRDKNAKRAVQAANSGLLAARHRANLMQPDDQQCPVKVAGQLTNVAVAGGWCAEQSEDLGDGAAYTMQISAASDVVPAANGQQLVQRTVVSTGMVNGVRRRATTTLVTAKGSPLPPGYAIVSGKKLKIDDRATVTGGLGSNGDIEFKKDSTVCGPPPITYGKGKQLKVKENLSTCGYPPVEATQSFVLPPVDLSGPKASNDNVRITNAVNGSGTPTDTCSRCDKISWSPVTRELTLEKDAVLTLSGNVYLVCKLEVKKGATLQIGARTTPLMFYLDSQDNCKKGSEATIDGKILNLNSAAASFILLAAGKPSHPTHIHGKIKIGKDAITASEAPMAIYAPMSKVEIKENLDFKGTIVGGEVKIKKDVNITYDVGPSVPTVKLYDSATGAYKECTSVATSTTPSSGC